ncbi:helix-turn-helix domain-containing protein [Providencia rettgeri]
MLKPSAIFTLFDSLILYDKPSFTKGEYHYASTLSALVGAKLKAERASQGYKRHDTRQKINKRDLQLFRYEHGINKIDLDTLINYCHALTLDIYDFLC